MNRAAASGWFTAAEIAELGLPGLPANKRRVHDLAATNNWSDRIAQDGSPLARQRKARGGGIEYHSSLLPDEARAVLAARAIAYANASAANDTGDGEADAWAWYDAQPAAIKLKAVERMNLLAEIEAGTDRGIGKVTAIQTAARKHEIAARTISEWFALVAGAPRASWLPRLAPQYKGGGKSIDIDAEAWRIIKSDYLRPEKPSFAACYNRLIEDYARPRGISLPSRKTLKRRLDREVSHVLLTTKREGREALRRTVPPLRRTVSGLHAMQAVNVDGHKFDVFVQWEDGRIGRPIMVGIQDVYSRKLLAHRIGETENTLLTRMVFADLFRDYGIPTNAVLDNGRAFASKALTGGAKSRFRFKINDNDPLGILTALGITTHWTLPYRGSSKPIERAWRDLCEYAAKHPAISGAYTGNRPDAKPDNYREKAIPIAAFREHVSRSIAAHNARTGRATEAANGKSFDEAFAHSYGASAIGRATPEQLRLALLEAQDRRCERQDGSFTLAGNRYWSPDMIELAGKKVCVRFDPDNLHSDVHVYLESGQYSGVASVIEKTGFFDKDGAVRRAKLEADVRRKARAAAQANDLLFDDQLTQLLSVPSSDSQMPEAAAIRIVRQRGHTAVALKPSAQCERQEAADNFIDRFSSALGRLRAIE